MVNHLKHDIRHKLNEYRFSIFLFTQLLILFGSLFFPKVFFDNLVSPSLVIINLIAGLFIIPLRSHFRKIFYFLVSMLVVELILSFVGTVPSKTSIYWRFISYLVVYVMISYHLILQIWRAREIDAAMIMGLISGYISLGLIGFFMLYAIYMIQPEAFDGVLIADAAKHQTRGSQLLYFSFITLLTIGYGDISPVLPVSQKATMVIGLMGQLYLVIITSITVGKYIGQFNSKKTKS